MRATNKQWAATVRIFTHLDGIRNLETNSESIRHLGMQERRPR